MGHVIKVMIISISICYKFQLHTVCGTKVFKGATEHPAVRRVNRNLPYFCVHTQLKGEIGIIHILQLKGH